MSAITKHADSALGSIVRPRSLRPGGAADIQPVAGPREKATTSHVKCRTVRLVWFRAKGRLVVQNLTLGTQVARSRKGESGRSCSAVAMGADRKSVV